MFVDFNFQRTFYSFEIFAPDDTATPLYCSERVNHDGIPYFDPAFVNLSTSYTTVNIVVSKYAKKLCSAEIAFPFQEGRHNMGPLEFVIGAPSIMTSLTCWAMGLDNYDTVGNSDPYFMVSIPQRKDGNEGSPEKVLYTSQASDSHTTPVWKKADFNIPIHSKNLKITILDHDNTSHDEEIGTCIVPVPFRNGEYPLRDSKTQQIIGTYIIGDEKKMIKFQAWADELKDTDFIGKIEPYLKIFCGDRLLAQTKSAEGICPVFGEIEVGIPLAANSLTVKIYEKDAGKFDSFLGECKISLPISDQKVNLTAEGSLESMPGQFCIGKPWKLTNLTCWALGFQPEEDPCFMVYSTGENQALLYESEPVRNSSTPVWKRAKFEVPADAKTMHFKFLDHNTLNEDDPIAECVVPFKNGFQEGVYPITEQMLLVIGDDLQEFDLECWANELEDTDWFGKIEPYFTISIEERIYYKSPCVRKGAHPVWPKVNVSISKFFSDFMVKIYDKDSASVDDFLGSCQVKLPLEEGSVYDLGVGTGFQMSFEHVNGFIFWMSLGHFRNYV